MKYNATVMGPELPRVINNSRLHDKLNIYTLVGKEGDRELAKIAYDTNFHRLVCYDCLTPEATSLSQFATLSVLRYAKGLKARINNPYDFAMSRPFTHTEVSGLAMELNSFLPLYFQVEPYKASFENVSHEEVFQARLPLERTSFEIPLIKKGR